jgi:hypothetical protein
VLSQLPAYRLGSVSEFASPIGHMPDILDRLSR